jgi:uncharacterized membrane protein
VNLQNAKSIYVISCFILGLIILSPTFFAVVPLPEDQKFTELWLLGPNHTIQSGAVNVSLYKPYTSYIGVRNQMNNLEYYTVYVKFRSESEAFQEQATGLPSLLTPVYEYPLFLRNNQTWETKFVFSFEKVSFDNNISKVTMISINGNDVDVDTTLIRDESDGGFYCQMLFELWIYNATTSSFQYNDRSVRFWLNLIEPV